MSSICQADIRILFARKPKVVQVSKASDVLQWDQFAATYPISDNMEFRQQHIRYFGRNNIFAMKHTPEM
jgi:hypothetical protein